MSTRCPTVKLSLTLVVGYPVVATAEPECVDNFHAFIQNLQRLLIIRSSKTLGQAACGIVIAANRDVCIPTPILPILGAAMTVGFGATLAVGWPYLE
jgi:hypothetical protein